MEDKIRLWTVQSIEVWERLKREKSLFVDPALLGEDFDFFRISYHWMRVQMNKRLKGYRGHYPWWALYQPKHDLRTSEWTRREERYAGQKRVRMELLMPREEVLLSDFDNYDCILNRWYRGETAEDWDRWEIEAAAHGIDTLNYCNLPPLWRHRVHQSWERIFNVPPDPPADDWIQANFEELRLENVVRITEFKFRLEAKRR